MRLPLPYLESALTGASRSHEHISNDQVWILLTHFWHLTEFTRRLFGWERKMSERVAEKREDELNWLWTRQMFDLVNGTIKYVHLAFQG